jgi:Protein of unknown function (DUF3618)
VRLEGLLMREPLWRLMLTGLAGHYTSRRVAPGGVAIFGTVNGSPRRPVTVAGHLENAANLRNRVTDMAETETDDTSKLAPKALVGQIERTRADLARTIDEIADRVNPSNVARRATDDARERISQIDPLIGGAVVLAVVSVTCYMVWRRLRK